MKRRGRPQRHQIDDRDGAQRLVRIRGQRLHSPDAWREAPRDEQEPRRLRSVIGARTSKPDEGLRRATGCQFGSNTGRSSPESLPSLSVSLRQAVLLAGDASLDVGFGEGYGAEILHGSVADYVGLDASPEAVGHASSHYPFSNVRFEQSDARTIPFDKASFDLVVSFHVLEHIEEPVAYLTEMARVCRPGGRLVVVTPNGAFRLRHGERPWNRFHVREFDSAELEQLLSRHFSRFAVEGIGGTPR